MTISHTVGITTLQICNNSNNIVSNVTVSVASSDSSDPTGTLETNWASIGLSTTGGTSAAGFVTYTNLTESEVLSWSDFQGIGISTYVENIKVLNTDFINVKINPPTPSYVPKELPW
tara:strand:+ start:88 stop:438 length:351 start_codon:yes stop_codon:yes gene_type:complete